MSEPIFIDDPLDPRLDDYRDLNHSDNRPDLPGGKGLVIAEGSLVVPRLLESRFPVRSVLGFGNRLKSFLDSYGDPGVPVLEVTRETLAAVAGFDMHRGLLAAADRPEELDAATILDDASTVVVLEGVGDHENIGSIFRNAAGLGVDAVLFGAGCADPLYRRVVRVSMGHVLRLPFARLEGTAKNWHTSLDLLHERGFTTVSLTPDPDAEHLADAIASREKVAFLVGAEGPGLTERTMRATHVRARIPMSLGSDSLNVATAAAVAFYERDRRLYRQ